MKKQTTTQYADIYLRVPVKEKVKIKGIIRNLLNLVNVDYTIVDDNISGKDYFSFEEVFPNLHPGSAIKGLRYREGLTQVELAKRIGIPRRHICEMENGKRKIDKEIAKRLANELNTKEKVFMCL